MSDGREYVISTFIESTLAVLALIPVACADSTTPKLELLIYEGVQEVHHKSFEPP